MNLCEALPKLTHMLQSSQHVVVLTGAGMSTESGIPDFRSNAGWWSDERLMNAMTIAYCDSHPDEFWGAFRKTFLSPEFVEARPNLGHHALAAFERTGGRHVTILTQNVDGLHQQAGSRAVLELHGHLRTATCPACGQVYDMRALPMEETPVCTAYTVRGDCGHPLRPDVVLFGQEVQHYAAAALSIQAADALLVLGSSMTVHPVAQLPQFRVASKCPLVVINETETEIDACADMVLRGKIGSLLLEALASS